MNPDEYITGTFDKNNPANQEELPPLTELEEQQNWNMELCEKIALMKNQIAEAKKIIEFCLDVTGENVLIYNKLKSILYI